MDFSRTYEKHKEGQFCTLPSAQARNCFTACMVQLDDLNASCPTATPSGAFNSRSEEHTSELQSVTNLVCRLLLEKKRKKENKRNKPTKNNISISHTLYT